MNRIVVIEDDPAIRRGLAAVLESESYDVLTAGDGEEGYRMVRDSRPDLVILDLMLPGMDGYEVCRQVRSHGLMTPILMLTAQDRESNRVQGFDSGADDYVTKPFSVPELLGRVGAILRRSEGRADLANQRELDEARRIQQQLMPSETPQIPGFQIAASWRPARITSGDYFDVLRFNDGLLGLCIADVCGKGMPAAMLMSNLQAAVKAFATAGASPRELCGQINRLMCGNIAQGKFISLFYAVLDAGRSTLTSCNAGHNPPILVSSAGVRRLDVGGVVLGVMERWEYNEQKVPLHPGDRLLMYTDGITECCNAGGEEFGEQRLMELATHFMKNDARLFADEVIGTASRFSNGNFEDDLTVVTVLVD